MSVLNARGDARVEQLIAIIGRDRYVSWFGGALFVNGPPARVQLKYRYTARRVSEDFSAVLREIFGDDVVVEYQL